MFMEMAIVGAAKYYALNDYMEERMRNPTGCTWLSLKRKNHTGCGWLRTRALRAYSLHLCLLRFGSSSLYWNRDIDNVKDEERGDFP